MHETPFDATVAYFGTEGSFTNIAAKKYFSDSYNFRSCEKFRDVFTEVAENKSKYGVIPIENTLAGSIYENYDLLSEYSLTIVGEVSLRIEHALIVHASQRDIDMTQIKKVFSHQKALEQCNIFLSKYPNMDRIAYGDTASSAKHIASSGANEPWAAIAHPANAAHKDLTVIKNNIEDDPSNHTRFLVISKSQLSDDDANKLSLSLHLKHEPGSLSKILNILSNIKVNLTKIESRPLPSKPFEYVFYLDIILPLDVNHISVIDDIRLHATLCTVLGLYKPSLDINFN